MTFGTFCALVNNSHTNQRCTSVLYLAFSYPNTKAAKTLVTSNFCEMTWRPRVNLRRTHMIRCANCDRDPNNEQADSYLRRDTCFATLDDSATSKYLPDQHTDGWFLNQGIQMCTIFRAYLCLSDFLLCNFFGGNALCSQTVQLFCCQI